MKLELKFEQVNTKIKSVKVEIKESKNETLKWFVGMFFFALALMIIGLYLKKMSTKVYTSLRKVSPLLSNFFMKLKTYRSLIFI